MTWEPDHKSHLEAQLALEANLTHGYDPDPWTEAHQRLWANQRPNEGEDA